MYKFLLSFCLIFALSQAIVVNAQKRTYSPASRYGIGEIKRGHSGQSSGMGQTGIALGSTQYLNNANPASYSTMDSLSFYFEAGLRGYYQEFIDNTSKAANSNMVFDYLAIGFPLSKKIHASLGLNTFSETGYHLQSEKTDSETYGTSITTYQGTGSINKTYLGLSMEPIKDLRIGAHASYLFGTLKNANVIQLPSDPSALPYGTLKETHVSDIYFDFGAQTQIKLSSTKRLTVGAVFTPKQQITNDFSSIKAQKVIILEDNTPLNSIDTLDHSEHVEPNFGIPLSYGFGLTYSAKDKITMKDKLTLSIDYKFENWADITIPDSAANKVSDYERISFGVEYIPDFNNIDNYYKRIRYRFGAYHSLDYIKLEDENCREVGISFGLGFPMRRSKNSINVAFELGQKDFYIQSNYKERFGRVLVNFSLHEYWFLKSKFD